MEPSRLMATPSEEDIVLVASISGALRDALASRLADGSLRIVETSELAAAVPMYRTRRPAAVVLGSEAGEHAAFETARQIRRINPRAVLILVTKHGSEATAVAALRAGISDYFRLPVRADEIVESVRRQLSSEPGRRRAEDRPDDRRSSTSQAFIGGSEFTQQLRSCVARIAAYDANVIITGETGTGKEVVALMLHAGGGRSAGPFVPVNCAAIPDSLVESELFGYERGAFTGATVARDGHLQHAHRGTMFLDEIGEMGAYAQAKILRAIEHREVVRLGGRGALPVDIRVVAATNQDLERAMDEGRFRKDLYFRLSVAHIHLLPLRDRREDIPGLLDYYVTQSCKQFDLDVRGFTPEALRWLVAYEWPGNVRELKNVVEAAFLNGPRNLISVADLPRRGNRTLQQGDSNERQRLVQALSETNWNKSEAARTLHWSRMTLYRKLAKYHLLRTAAT